MSLVEFSEVQEKLVRERARKLRTYWTLRPQADMEKLARREIDSFPELRGVSVRELLNEVLIPGSFSNS